jgi:hypothetical protein
MDQTSHAAAVVVPLASALGLVGLITVPAMAMRQATRDAVLAERAWVRIRAERRQAALAEAAPESPSPELVESGVEVVGAGRTITGQRRGSTAAVS